VTLNILRRLKKVASFKMTDSIILFYLFVSISSVLTTSMSECLKKLRDILCSTINESSLENIARVVCPVGCVIRHDCRRCYFANICCSLRRMPV